MNKLPFFIFLIFICFLLMDCRSARTEKPEKDIMDRVINNNYVNYQKNYVLGTKNQHLKYKTNEDILLIE